MKKETSNLALPILGISLLANVIALFLYFYKINPLINNLKTSLKSTQEQLSTNNCKKVYSQSEGKIVCLTNEQLKSMALTDCSKNFRENLNEKVLGALKSVSDLEKLQQLSVKMCMQERGFDY